METQTHNGKPVDLDRLVRLLVERDPGNKTLWKWSAIRTPLPPEWMNYRSRKIKGKLYEVVHYGYCPTRKIAEAEGNAHIQYA